MSSSLGVLHEDTHLIAVDKPAGFLTQGRVDGEPTLEDEVRRYLLEAGAIGASPGFLGTVHRLDRPVSGVVVWAKTEKAARRLSAQFAARTTRKLYVALSRPSSDFIAESAGVWEDWLTASTDPSGTVHTVERAVTRFAIDASAFESEGIVLLRLEPETGRTHQLRVQAALRGLPIWGDLLYGSSHAFDQGVALHAAQLAFEHPTTKERLQITACLPKSWGSVASRFDLKIL